MSSTGKREFLESVKNGLIPPVFNEIPYCDPAGLYPCFSGPFSFILESVKGSPQTARYSFIGFEPYCELKVKDGLCTIKTPHGSATFRENPIKAIRRLLAHYRQAPDVRLPPFQGGAAGLLCYDFVHYLERLPATAVDDLRLPDAHILMIDRLIAFDHLEKKAWAIVCPGARDMALPCQEDTHTPGTPGPETRSGSSSWEERYDEAQEVMGRILREANSGNRKTRPCDGTGPGADIEVVHEVSEAQYKGMVRRVKDYIAAGDIFQANISLRVSAPLQKTDPWQLYTVLREINPSPFAGFLDFGEYSIVSSSPERLVMLRRGVLETRPIAGTRPRGGDATENLRLREELLLNEKERAEHIMLIDLERNDLGRVCDYGSVEVDEMMTTEDYSHVIHIVSNVKGRLAEGKTALDAIRALFPGGTITGVPKIRCMQIIDELEPFRRGPYTGSFGYIGFSGEMDLNIIIRTFTIVNGRAYVQAGAGIVADSDPAREYSESLRKAEALLATLKRTCVRR